MTFKDKQVMLWRSAFSNTKRSPIQWDRNLPCRLTPTPHLNSPLTKSSLDEVGMV